MEEWTVGEAMGLSPEEFEEVANMAEMGGDALENLCAIGFFRLGVDAPYFITAAYALGRYHEKKQGVKTFIVRDES